jgi:rhomboid family GlyGly-CTERM serine protease
MNRPVITAAVVLLAIVALAPEVAAAFVYDRGRIVSGEFWRLITCNSVHFSRSHFVYDVMAFGVAGTLIEVRGYRGFGLVCLLTAVFVGATVFLLQPEIEMFGGLSGLATAAIAFLSLHGLRDRGAWKWISVAALIAIVLKTAFESVTGEMVFAQSGSVVIKPVPLSHLAGGFGALLVYLMDGRYPREREAGRLPYSTHDAAL